MREEINRILKLVEDGKLTGEQASEMIAVLSEAGGRARQQRGPVRHRVVEQRQRRREERQERDHERRERHRHQRRHRRGRFNDLFDDIGIDIRQVVDEALRSVNIGQTLRGMFDPGGGDPWAGDSNRATFAKAEEPTGSNHKVEDNHVVVSQIGDLRLDNAEFCGNQLHAAAVQDVAVVEGVCNDNAWRGSSLKRATVEHSTLADNQFNGTQVAKLTMGRSTFSGNKLSGVQIRELGLADSKLDGCQMHHARLRNVMLKDRAHLADVTLSDVVGNNCVLESSSWSRVTFKGTTIGGLTAEGANLVNCTFVNCKFDGTAMRNVDGENLRFEDVDFSGLTISSTAQLSALADAADAA